MGAAARNTVNPRTFGPSVNATLGGMLAPQGPSAPASYVDAVKAGAAAPAATTGNGLAAPLAPPQVGGSLPEMMTPEHRAITAAMNPSGGQNDFFALANIGSTLTLSPNADPRGVPTPTAAMNPSGGQTLASLMGGGGGPMPANQALPLSPNADFRGAPAPLIANTPVGGGKGGGMLGQLMPRPTQGQFAPLAPQGQFNVNQAAAGGLQQAMMGTQAGMGFQPSAVQATGYRPATGMAQGYNAAQAGARGYGAQNIRGAGPVTAQQVTAGQIAGTDLGVYLSLIHI